MDESTSSVRSQALGSRPFSSQFQNLQAEQYQPMVIRDKTACVTPPGDQGRAWPMTIRTLLGLSCIMALLACVPLTQAQTDPPAPTPVTESEPKNSVSQLAMRLTDTRSDAYLRRAAAFELLSASTTEAEIVIRSALTNFDDLATQRAVLGALVSMTNPPKEYSSLLISMFEKADDSLISDIAWALGRYDDHLLIRELSSLAQNTGATRNLRHGAILTLGHQRTISTAKLLIGLIDEDQPEYVRQAAFESLSTLSSQPELGQDIQAWHQWWEENRRLSAAKWDAQLLARFSLRAEALTRLNSQAVERLVETQRQLLRVAPQEQRPALLATMLQDQLEPVRRLAVEQLDQRARAGESTEPILREGLLKLLDDPSPQVRLATAKLLRNLRDEAGSRERTSAAVAARLMSLKETNEDVLHAYLLLLTDTPVRSAVDRQIDLLRNSSLREDAAGAITSAIDKNLVDEDDLKLLKAMFISLAPDNQPPEPKLIELLGRIASEDDWTRIARWLDHTDERVRLAAARAWAQSDRSLVGLAPYTKEPTLQPIIIDAAYRRGRSVATLVELIHNRPAQEQVAQSWQAALVAMAGRIPAKDALMADAQLAKGEEPLSLRVDFMGAAVAALERVLGSGTEVPPSDDAPKVNQQPRVPTSTIADLYLHHSRLLLSLGSAESAMGQLDKLAKLELALSVSQQLNMDQLKLEILSALGDLDKAMVQSTLILSRTAELGQPDRDDAVLPMIKLFVNWTGRSITTSQLDQAQRILLYLRTEFAQSLTADHQTELTAFEATIAKLRQPPVVPVPVTPPVTVPAAGESVPAPAPTPASAGSPVQPSPVQVTTPPTAPAGEVIR